MIEKRNSLLFSEGVRRHRFSKVDVSDQLIKLRMERFLKGAADGRGGRELRMQRKSSGKYFKIYEKNNHVSKSKLSKSISFAAGQLEHLQTQFFDGNKYLV